MADPNQNPQTVIGPDSHFNGELRFENTARIVGKFDGSIVGKGELNVDQAAVCKANIEAANATVDGTVEGNVTASESIRLNANGIIRGDIVAAKMVMAEGARFSGRCEIGGDGARGGSAPSGGGGAGGGGGGNSGGGGNPNPQNPNRNNPQQQGGGKKS